MNENKNTLNDEIAMVRSLIVQIGSLKADAGRLLRRLESTKMLPGALPARPEANLTKRSYAEIKTTKETKHV